MTKSFKKPVKKYADGELVTTDKKLATKNKGMSTTSSRSVGATRPETTGTMRTMKDVAGERVSPSKLSGSESSTGTKAERPLSKALQASDDSYRATREEAQDKLKMATKPKPGEYDFKKGGAVKKAYKAGGAVKSGASRGDGCAQRGRTRGKYC